MSIRQGFAGRAGATIQAAATTVLAAATAGIAYYLVSQWLEPTRSKRSGVDIVALQRRVLVTAGRSGIDVNDLGGGIVELVGESHDAREVAALIESVTGAPGVEVVLDRLWVRTPRLVS